MHDEEDSDREFAAGVVDAHDGRRHRRRIRRHRHSIYLDCRRGNDTVNDGYHQHSHFRRSGSHEEVDVEPIHVDTPTNYIGFRAHRFGQTQDDGCLGDDDQ